MLQNSNIRKGNFLKPDGAFYFCLFVNKFHAVLALLS